MDTDSVNIYEGEIMISIAKSKGLFETQGVIYAEEMSVKTPTACDGNLSIISRLEFHTKLYFPSVCFRK